MLSRLRYTSDCLLMEPALGLLRKHVGEGERRGGTGGWDPLYCWELGRLEEAGCCLVLGGKGKGKGKREGERKGRGKGEREGKE